MLPILRQILRPDSSTLIIQVPQMCLVFDSGLQEANSNQGINIIARKLQKQDSALFSRHVPRVMGRRVLLAIPLAHNLS